jgi:hypothetical protein
MGTSNSDRQQQCKQAPFQMAPLLDIMGYLMDNDEIPLDMSITLEDNRSGWKKQTERTASEPTGLSFNHYKTACLTDDLNEVDSFLRTAPLQLATGRAQL